MEVVADAKRGRFVGDASMGYGVGGGVRLQLVLHRGSSLTVLRLRCSLHLLPWYDIFRSRLEQSLPLLDRGKLPATGDGAIEGLPTTGDETIDAVLKVLQAEKTEDRDRMGDDIGRSATDRDIDMVDGTGQPQAPMGNVDDALKILVYNATQEFGFAS